MPPQLSQASLFNRGGSTPPPAISPGMQAILTQQQQDQSKLLKNMEKLQQENMQANEQARQAGGAGMAEVANQITSALDARNKGQEKKRDRVENLQQQQDFAEFQAQLNKEATADAVRIGQGIQSQREAASQFTENFRGQKNKIKQTVSAKREQLRQMWENGLFFRQENGVETYSGLVSALDDVDAQADDHFSDDNLSEVYNLQNKVIRNIISGEDHMDLSNLRVDPMLVETPGIISKGRTKPTMDGNERFRRKLTGGYPMEGVLANPPKNGEIPPKLITPEFLMDVLLKDQELTGLVDEKNRNKLVNGWKRKAMNTSRIVSDYADVYEGINRQTETLAAPAAEKAFQEFLTLPDPNKWQQMPRLVTALALKNMFPDGNGDEMAARALDIYDGKRDPKSQQELMEAMVLESSIFAIQNTMLSNMKGPVGSQPLVEQIVQQINGHGGETALYQFAGVSPTGHEGTDKVTIRAGIMRKLTGIQGYAARVSEGLKSTSALTEYRRALSTNVREVDLLATHHLLSQTKDHERAMKMLDSQFSDTARGLSLEQAENAQVTNDTEYNQNYNMMDALIIHANEMGPDVLREVSHAITGGVEDISSPNVKIYDEEVKRGIANPTTKQLMDIASRHYTEREQLRMARMSQASSSQPSDPNKSGFSSDQPVGQSFQKGGLPAATSNVAGKVLGGVAKAGERFFTGAVTAAGGEGAGSAFLKGLRKIQSSFPGSSIEETPREKKEGQ